MEVDLKVQWKTFKEWLLEAHPEATIREAIGASNGAFMLGEGFRLGLFNVDSVGNDQPAIVASRVVLPRGQTLNLALLFDGDELAPCGDRISAIREEDNQGAANKVRVFLHQSGVYLRQGGGDPDVVRPDDGELGEPLRATAAYYADVMRPAGPSPTELEYISYIAELLGDTPFTKLSIGGPVGNQPLNPAEADVDELQRRISELGGVFSKPLLQRYHAALNHLSHKHFALLTGISGTGKTMLSRLYALAILGESSVDSMPPELIVVPVRPDWTEPSHLLGYLDALSGCYRTTPFLEAMLRADADSTRPVFVVVDEMNLAQPEHYMADVISAMEIPGQEIHLHDGDAESAGVPTTIRWPSNLYLTGTVNDDETTRPFSPRLKDRANVIDMSDEMDVEGFIRHLQDEPGMDGILDDGTRQLLCELDRSLRPHRLHFGNRTIREIAAYMRFCRDTKLLGEAALDVQLDQKVLTKLRGGPDQREMLERLVELLEDMPTCGASLQRMRRELDAYDGFQYGA